MPSLARILIIAGVVLVLAGCLLAFGGKWTGRIGNLPGDIRIERENVRFYFPVTTMILLSLLLSLIIWLFRRFF